MKFLTLLLLFIPVTFWGQSIEAKKILNEGNQKYKDGNYLEAAKIYQKAIDLEKNWEKPLKYQAQAYYLTNKFSECIESLNKLIVLEPKDPEHYILRAKCKHQLFQFLEALTDAEIALSLDENSYNAYQVKGFIRLELDDYKGAIKEYSKAIKLKPNFAQAIHERGIAHYKDNNKLAACLDWENASVLGFELSTEKVEENCSK